MEDFCLKMKEQVERKRLKSIKRKRIYCRRPVGCVDRTRKPIYTTILLLHRLTPHRIQNRSEVQVRLRDLYLESLKNDKKGENRMNNQTKQLTPEVIKTYQIYLLQEERSTGTIEKYMRDVRAFACWLRGREVSGEQTSAWKEYLRKVGYAPRTINSMLSALNGLFRLMKWESCCVKFLKIQRQMFRDPARELSRKEYQKLVNTAFGMGKERLGMVAETMGGTGIRVSELGYITAEAVRLGQARIFLKGKIRVILLPEKLCKKLKAYCQKQKIASGPIFVTRNKTALSRRQIWAELKALSKKAGVEASKVFPHNLRHLFAKTFYRASRDLVRLADVLGHSSIETTRIYLISTGAEHLRQLDGLGLIS